MSDKSTSVQVGPGLAGSMTILFVILKVTNYIDWSWWWVFSPLWISAAVVLAILAVCGAVIGLAAAVCK